MNLQLKNLKYLKLPYNARLDGELLVSNKNTFLAEFMFMRENGNKIGILDSRGSLIKSFFDKSPVTLPVNGNKNKMDAMKTARGFILAKETAPIIGSDTDGKLVLISFEKPDNPIQFYVYNMKGEPVKEFSYVIEDKRYKISDFYFKATPAEIANPKKYPDKTFAPYIQSQYIHKNGFSLIINSLLANQKK